MKKVNLTLVLALLLMSTVMLLSCISSTQPISQEQQLHATIVALQTQVALGQQSAQVTPTAPSSPSSQEQKLQATIVALQTEAARSSASVTMLPTSVPSPTPIPTTQPDSILDVGQVWRQGGVEVVLKEDSLNTYGLEGILFKLYFTNRKPQDISILYSLDNLNAVDNLGRRLDVIYFDPPYELRCDPQTRIVHSGESIKLSCAEYYLILVSIGNPTLTEVIVSVTGISDISEARWRIPVYH